MQSPKMTKVKGEKMNDFPIGKNTRILPTFRLTDEDLPEIKDWKVGGKYTLVMEVEQISMRQGDEWQGADNKDKRVHATFKVTSVAVEENDDSETPSKDPKSSDNYEMEYAQKMSGKK